MVVWRACAFSPCRNFRSTLLNDTLDERISRESGWAQTRNCVIDHLALSFGSTRSRTRISTFVVDASQVRRTVRVDYTFGPTLRRGSDVRWQTTTRRIITGLYTLRIRATRRRDTRVLRRVVLRRKHWFWNWHLFVRTSPIQMTNTTININVDYWILTRYCITASERISRLSFSTTADRTVVDHFTSGSRTARPYAWIDTFRIHARLIRITFRADYALWTAGRRCACIIW